MYIVIKKIKTMINYEKQCLFPKQNAKNVVFDYYYHICIILYVKTLDINKELIEFITFQKIK